MAQGSEELRDSSRQFEFHPQVLSINVFIKHQDQSHPQLEHDRATKFSSMKSPTIGDKFKKGLDHALLASRGHRGATHEWRDRERETSPVSHPTLD